MNYMKKLLGAGGSAGPPPQAASAGLVGSIGGSGGIGVCGPNDSLGLMHLAKLYAEFADPGQPLTAADQQLKLYNMLPLFCKVFENCPAESVQASFEHVVPFARAVAKLLVSEIRRRASNRSTESASAAIARFLEPSPPSTLPPTSGAASPVPTGAKSNAAGCGWLLLTAINLLAGAGPRVVEALVSQALPSTLVKCLYLFFDLPAVEAAPSPALAKSVTLVSGSNGDYESQGTTLDNVAPNGVARSAASTAANNNNVDSKCSDSHRDVKASPGVYRDSEARGACIDRINEDDEQQESRESVVNVKDRSEDEGQTAKMATAGDTAAVVNNNTGDDSRRTQPLTKGVPEAAGAARRASVIGVGCQRNHTAAPAAGDETATAEAACNMRRTIQRRRASESAAPAGLQHQQSQDPEGLTAGGDRDCRTTSAATSGGLSPLERRILLQKVFIQLVMRLCSQPCAAEELAQRDDLALLFSAITTWCPEHNAQWRKSAAELLMTVSRHGLSKNVVAYVHQQRCIATCVDNMRRRMHEFSSGQLLEMFVCVFCLLKDSSEISHLLLDDFAGCSGYGLVADLVIRCEQDLLTDKNATPVTSAVAAQTTQADITASDASKVSPKVARNTVNSERERREESDQVLSSLSVLLTSLVTCGSEPLKPVHPLQQQPQQLQRQQSQQSNHVVQPLFHLEGFVLPPALARGTCVRNLEAYAVIEGCFWRARSERLQNLLADSLQSIYRADAANYFILEPHYPLASLLDAMHNKPKRVQCGLLKLVEYVPEHLRFVPCKELTSLATIIKNAELEGDQTILLCLETLQNVINVKPSLFKNVFREVGLLEALVIRLQLCQEECELVRPIVDVLQVLLSCSQENCTVFRDSGGLKCAQSLLRSASCRPLALVLFKEVMTSSASPDEDMTWLLAAVQTAEANIDLKIDCLLALHSLLGESHRIRSVFRKVGGFVYLMTLLACLENCISPAQAPLRPPKLLRLIRVIFNTIAVAMRYEPANAKLFATEICQTSLLVDSLRLLGCFAEAPSENDDFSQRGFDHIHAVFTGDGEDDLQRFDYVDVCTLIIRFLYDMAVDCSDIASELQLQISGQNSAHCTVVPFGAELCLSLPPNEDPLIVHAGVVSVLLQLLPSLQNRNVQLYVAELLRSLVRTERNQQIACQAGLAGLLMSKMRAALEDESHPLHIVTQCMLERLAGQALEPRELRVFLRLGSPLKCDGSFKDGGPVPLTRIKTLVSMATPRDGPILSTAGAAFVELSLSREGFSCLFLPSIAPQSLSGPAMVGVVAADSVLGGIGAGDRMFPPQSGLAFSTWFLVERFGLSSHPVRLLSIGRQVRDEHSPCMCLELTERELRLQVNHDRATFVLPRMAGGAGGPSAVVSTGEWHHIVVSLSRSVLKNTCTPSVFLDGVLLVQQHGSANLKMSYVPPYSGGGSQSISAIIGTPPSQRQVCGLTWKQGPCHLIEEPLPDAFVRQLFVLGPSYVGSLQQQQHQLQQQQQQQLPHQQHQLYLGGGQQQLQQLQQLHQAGSAVGGVGSSGALLQVAEERIAFGLNAMAVSTMTIARMRRVYTKHDCKAIAKMLGLSSHENATPIRILHNSAAHLAGAARSLGAVLIGYLGARTFVPHPVSMTMESVGGATALLALMSQATNIESLYASLKVLVCVVRANRPAQLAMERCKGYQIVAALLKSKSSLLNCHILHLALSLVGSGDCAVSQGSISSMLSGFGGVNCQSGFSRSAAVAPFRDLLCNLDIWREAAQDLQRSYYEHLLQVATDATETVLLMRDLDLVSKITYTLSEPGRLAPQTLSACCDLLRLLLQNTPRNSDLLRFGQFIIWTLPPRQQDSLFTHLRVKCLQLLSAMVAPSKSAVNSAFCEQLTRVLGVDWFVVLLSAAHPDPSTQLLALQLLSCLLCHQSILGKFREASCNGGWLQETTDPALLGMRSMAGACTPASGGPLSAGALGAQSPVIKQEVLHVGGFQTLEWALTTIHPNSTFSNMLLAMLFSRPVTKLPCETVESGPINNDMFVTLCGVLRSMLFNGNDAAALAIMDVISRRWTDLASCCINNEESITALASIVFCQTSESDSKRQHCSSTTKHEISVNSIAATATVGSDETSNPVAEVKAARGALHSGQTTGLTFALLTRLMLEGLSSVQNAHIVDQLLSIEYHLTTSNEQQRQFTTLLLGNVMAELMESSSFGKLSQNALTQFTVTAVDKLWLGVFTPPPMSVVRFIAHLLLSNSGIRNYEVLRSFGRSVLFVLSRDAKSVRASVNRNDITSSVSSDDLLVDQLQCMQLLINNEQLLHLDADILGALAYSLTQFAKACSLPMDTIRRTTIHISPNDASLALASQEEAQLLMAAAASKLWQTVYARSRAQLEDSCRLHFSTTCIVGGTNAASSATADLPPDLYQLWETNREPLQKAWILFLDTEKAGKGSVVVSGDISSQIQNRVSRFTGGLSRLASRKIRKVAVVATAAHTLASSGVSAVSGAASDPTAALNNLSSSVVNAATATVTNKISQSIHINPHNFNAANLAAAAATATTGTVTGAGLGGAAAHHANSLSHEDYDMWTQVHIAIVQHLVDWRLKQLYANWQHLQQQVLQEWSRMEKTLISERGLWGPEQQCPLDKWMLDATESGPCRMRKRLIKNPLFYQHYPYIEHQPNQQLKYKVATSLDSKLYYEHRGQDPLSPIVDTFQRGSGPAGGGGGSAPCSPDIIGQQQLKIKSGIGRRTLKSESESRDELTTVARDFASVSAGQSVGSLDNGDIDDSDVTIMAGSKSSETDDSGGGLMGSHSDGCLRRANEAKTQRSRQAVSSNKQQSSESDDEDTGVPGDDSVVASGDSVCSGALGATSVASGGPVASSATASSQSPDSQSVGRLLEEGEKITHMFRCGRVQGLDTFEGLLLFGREHFYVVDGYTLLKTREIRDISSLPARSHEPIIPNSCTPLLGHAAVVRRDGSASEKDRLDSTASKTAAPANDGNGADEGSHSCSKFCYDDVREVHKRRYLLQPTALEVFSADGRNYLLVFPRKLRNKVYARFLALATGITDSAHESLAGQRRSANVESGAGILSSLMGETSVTQRWLRGEISNFQYLMHLNTLAGRSYNDLMQYPVFPWIIADYDSDALDLNDPKSFRDLGKPMGAQTSNRLEQFCRRYKEWDDPETPPYHYGTFYSSAMIVASYLVRMEPFTQHFLRLQGGHFDLADRMFDSVKDAYTSASKYNMADVKELIPEFFYLDEFLVNKNRFDLGVKQSGVQLDNVVLPNWAKGSPREFIRLHRAALESDYVSSHLHEWIDLIFGYRQQGQPAVEAVNVFHHLFYEGNVDIYSIDDPLKKNATIGFINNFGQIPKQLFKKPHPAKKVESSNSSLKTLFYHKIESLRPSMHPVRELKGPVGQIFQQERSLLAVEQNKMLLPPNQKYVSWGFADYSIRVCNYETDKCVLVWEDQITSGGEVLCATCPDAKTIITAGTSCLLTIWTVTPKRLELRNQLSAHTDAVTCVASSKPYNLVVSGSRDESCILWDLSRLTFIRQIPTDFGAPVAAVHINDVTGDIATCAATRLYLYNVNGMPIAHVDTMASLPAGQTRGQQILCACFSQLNEWDKDSVIMTGSSDGILRMWSLSVDQEGASLFLRGKLTMHTAFERPDNKEPAAITAIGVSRDHRHVYVGDVRGRVFQWSVSSETGARSDHWVRDDTAEQCSNSSCQVKFSLTERRHHCRNCGQLFCAKCSRYEAQINRIDSEKNVRVCYSCFNSLSTTSSI